MEDLARTVSGAWYIGVSVFFLYSMHARIVVCHAISLLLYEAYANESSQICPF